MIQSWRITHRRRTEDIIASTSLSPTRDNRAPTQSGPILGNIPIGREPPTVRPLMSSA